MTLEILYFQFFTAEVSIELDDLVELQRQGGEVNISGAPVISETIATLLMSTHITHGIADAQEYSPHDPPVRPDLEGLQPVFRSYV